MRPTDRSLDIPVLVHRMRKKLVYIYNILGTNEIKHYSMDRRYIIVDNAVQKSFRVFKPSLVVLKTVIVVV